MRHLASGLRATPGARAALPWDMRAVVAARHRSTAMGQMAPQAFLPGHWGAAAALPEAALPVALGRVALGV